MTASFKYANIRCYRSSSRFQVTPRRMSCPCLVSFSVGHYDVLVSTPDSMFSVVWFCDEGVVTGDRCNSRMRARPNRLSVLKKFALLIGFACCVSRPGACGGLWTRQMLLVCSTYVSVTCMFCVLFDLRRKKQRSHQNIRKRHFISEQ